MNTQLKIMSYNSRDLGGINYETIRQFLDDNNTDFVLMQETWLFKNNLQMLSGIHNDYMIHGKSFVPDDKILTGRPYGGLGILWRKSMAINVQATDINSDQSSGVLVILAHKSISMILNVYLPTDLRSMTPVSQEYEMCIDMLEMCSNRYAYDKLVIGGDFNTDFSRQ